MQLFCLKNKALFSQNIIDEHIYNINTRGYSIFTDFLLVEECNILKVGIEKAISDYKPREASERSALDQYQIHDLMAKDINHAKLLEDPRLQQLISPFLAASWIMYAATSSSIPPNGINYANRLHVDSPRYYPGYIFNLGVIWALDDYSVENGALKILPGSQHSEHSPSLDYFEKNATQLICPQGSLIVFNARTFHRTCENRTAQWNHSMTLNACRAFMKQRMDWVRLLPMDIVSQLNHQAKRLIGYDTRLPTSLDEFFLPEQDRLYKANQG